MVSQVRRDATSAEGPKNRRARRESDGIRHIRRACTASADLGYRRPLRMGFTSSDPLVLAADRSTVRTVVSALLVVVGLALSAAVVRAFRRASTPVAVRRPTSRLVLDGPYRFTRNPDYLGQALTYAGVALFAGDWWLILLGPIAFAIVHYGVVLREERYLAVKFGSDHEAYMTKVPRWFGVDLDRSG